jgi:hypothetical protein
LYEANGALHGADVTDIYTNAKAIPADNTTYRVQLFRDLNVMHQAQELAISDLSNAVANTYALKTDLKIRRLFVYLKNRGVTGVHFYNLGDVGVNRGNVLSINVMYTETANPIWFPTDTTTDCKAWVSANNRLDFITTRTQDCTWRVEIQYIRDADAPIEFLDEVTSVSNGGFLKNSPETNEASYVLGPLKL